MGALEVRAETAEDLALGFRLSYYLERSERVVIRVMTDIDISSSNLFYDYSEKVYTDKVSLILNENCRMYIEENATLNLGEYVLGLHCNNFGEDKAKLFNYGTIIGDIVCEVGKLPSNDEVYSESDYIYNDGTVEGTIWTEDEYVD